MMNWDPLDVMTVLEVEPEIEEHETCYRYVAQRDGMEISVKVNPFESVVELQMRAVSSPVELLSFAVLIGGSCRRVSDARGEFLVLTEAAVAPDRFYWTRLARSRDEALRFDILIFLKPHIRVTFE